MTNTNTASETRTLAAKIEDCHRQLEQLVALGDLVSEESVKDAQWNLEQLNAKMARMSGFIVG